MGNTDRINEIIEAKKNDQVKKEDESKFVKEILIIEINLSYFGIQLEYLREVLDLPDKHSIIPIPFTPSYILGIMNLRGDIIPVVSMLEILGIPEREEDSIKVAILDNRFRIAFPFKDIIDLETIAIKDMKEIKDATKKPEERFLSHELDYKGKRVGVIDIYKVYSSQYFK